MHRGKGFTHWSSNPVSYYMERDKSCTVSNSPSEPKFTESICCENMIEIHCNYEHISIAGENYNLCAIISDGTKSMWNDTNISLFMVRVQFWVLAYYSIPDRLGLC